MRRYIYDIISDAAVTSNELNHQTGCIDNSTKKCDQLNLLVVDSVCQFQVA